MKLPRPTTRRYRVLKAFIGRAMGVDELMSGFGLFGFDWRSALVSELALLRQLGFLKGTHERYELTEATRQMFIEAGEEQVELVPPRTYNVYAQPPLDPRRLVNPNRRVSSIEKACSTHYCASDPIPFTVDE